MRTAHKVWAGVFAATFVVVATVQGCGNQAASREQSAAEAAQLAPALPALSVTVAPRDPMLGPESDADAGVAKSVGRVIDVDDVEFTDGYRARLDVQRYAETAPVEAWERCADRLQLAAAHRLLDGKTVTVGRDDTRTYTDRADWIRVVDSEAYDGTSDYSSVLSSQTSQPIMDQCYPKSAPAPSSTSDSDVDVDLDHHDTNHRDGAATAGFCRRHWWC